MAKFCELCGKGPSAGNSIVRKGLAKYKGGIGLHTTGVTRRRFLPNLQRVRLLENGGKVRRLICMQCLRTRKLAAS